MTDIMAVSLSSSLMVSRSVHTLRFERSRWRVPRNVFRTPRMSFWLGLALFSRFSHSGITKLTLDCETLTASNVAAMHEVSQSQNPFPLLRENKTIAKDSELSPPQMVRVLQDYTQVIKVADQPGIEDELLSEATVQPGAKYETPDLHAGDMFWLVHDDQDSNTMEILVPGYGVCVVGCDCVELKDAILPNAPPCIEELTVQCLPDRPDAIQGLTSLAQLVGANLTGFANIIASSTALKDEQFQTIVLSFPKLVHLDLDNLVLSSMQLLVDAFEQNACKRKTLHLSKVNVEDPTSIIAFAEALSNPRSRISRCLVEVKIFFGRIPVDALTALGRMHELNTRLEWCLIGANCQIREAVQSQFMAQQGRLISRKLPIRRKAAFLSLIKHSSFEAIRELDSFMIENIFGYSADMAPRTASIEHTHWT